VSCIETREKEVVVIEGSIEGERVEVGKEAFEGNSSFESTVERIV
jgi:hypothetical protein